MDILDAQQIEIRAAERAALQQLSTAIVPLDPEQADVEAVKQAEEDLEELFLLVIVGEFNSGKSSLINAMLGAEVLPEGVTPTTASINLLRYGPHAAERNMSDYVVERTYPTDFLRDISIVDTPGTNAIIRRHEELTRHFVPRSDLVIFITSADRPFTESERGFMETIREWGKKIIIVLNKIDLLQNQEEMQRVLTFIEENSVALLGQKPEIFPVSARMAKKGRGEGNGAYSPEQLLRASRLDQLEEYIFRTLDETERIRIKLGTPLGIAGRIADKYRAVARERLNVLTDDFKTVENIEADLNLYSEDMHREFKSRLTEIENIIYELKERGDAFFDDTIRVGRIRDLMNSEQIKREFEDRVVADTARRVDDATNGLIDWMVDKDLRQWQRVQEMIDRRRRAGSGERGLEGIGGRFAYNRDTLLKSVVQEARHVIDSYDRREEASIIAQDMRTAVSGVIAGAGVASLGLLMTIAISGAFIDITGITLALVGGAVGLFLLPYRKRKAQEEFRAKTQDLKDKLVSSMSRQFESELARSIERIR